MKLRLETEVFKPGKSLKVENDVEMSNEQASRENQEMKELIIAQARDHDKEISKRQALIEQLQASFKEVQVEQLKK